MIRILASDEQKAELLKREVDETRIVWTSTLTELVAAPAEAYLDLQYELSPERSAQLKSCLPAPVIVHSVTATLASIGHPFIRVNAWPGFLERQVMECAISGEHAAGDLKNICEILRRECILVPDEPGFITARIIAMIVNEAYFALEDAVSSKREIDIAMKTGTNYPFGPFEWSNKISLANILGLLRTLATTDDRYEPCLLMVKEVNSAAAIKR